MPSPKRISDIKPLFTNLAQTSHYELLFDGFPRQLRDYLNARDIDADFIGRKAGLLCYDASLPGSSLATANIEGNFTGVQQQYAHTRLFTNIGLGFYCDSEYKMLKFFEYWIEYISGAGAQDSLAKGYFYRMRYPDQYKCEAMAIVKFDRDYKNGMQYNFVSGFPVSVSSTPVSYETSSVLRINVEFNFDRYVVGGVGSIGAGGQPLRNITDVSDNAIYAQYREYNDNSQRVGETTAASGLNQFFSSPNEFVAFQDRLSNQRAVDDFVNYGGTVGARALPGSKYVNFTTVS